MKRILAALSVLCLAMACGGPAPQDAGTGTGTTASGTPPAGEPAAAVNGFLEAFKSGDGETASGYLSQSVIDNMSEGLEQFRGDTTGSALSYLSMMVGVELTQAQLDSMDGQQFAALFLGSDQMRQQFGAFDFTVGEAVASYSVTVTFIIQPDSMTGMPGDTVSTDFVAIQEGDSWKISKTPFGI